MQLINVCQYHLLNKALKCATAPDHFRNTMSHSPTGGSPNHSHYSCSSTNTIEPVTAVLNSTPKHTHVFTLPTTTPTRFKETPCPCP